MKKIILISLLLNLGLVAVVAYKLKTRSAVSTAEPSATGVVAVADEKVFSKTENSAPSEKKAATAPATVAAGKFSWHKVESEEYKKYIANLRAIHCPEATIRDIIFADINKYFRAKLAPYRKPKEQDGFQFWKTGNGWTGGNRESDEYYKMQTQFEKEKKALIKELLGVDYLEALRDRYGWPDNREKSDLLEKMPEEKKEKVQDIEQRFNELRQAFYRRTKGYQDEDDQAELRKMEKQKHDELAKILSPEELFEKEVRSSDMANNLKWNGLRGFDATEEEFRAIFKARQAAEFAQAENTSTNSAQPEWERSQQLQKKIETDLKDVLGDDRLKEYRLAQNYDYSSLVEIAQRNNLPKETAKEIYGMKADIEKAARDIRGDRNLTAEQRTEKLKMIRAETEKTVKELLGERGFRSFKRNAWWLRNISQ